MPLLETAEVILSEQPDRLIMMLPDLKPGDARRMANQAVREARRKMPKATGESAKRLNPVWGKGYFGILFQDCLAVGTRVLRADWRWVPVETLVEGDALIGFDEHVDQMAQGRGRGRRYRTAYVTGTSVQDRPCVEITFDDGTSVVSTENHPWLAKRYRLGTRREWINAADLRPGFSLGVYFETWEEERNYDAGWLAGMFDGEGSYAYNQRGGAAETRTAALTVTQNLGPVLDRVESLLKERGFDYGVRDKRGGGCCSLEIRGGFAEQVRLLGSIRPERLLAKVRHENRSMSALRERTVVSVVPVGDRPVVVMGTTEQTYMAEGMGSHNSYVWFQENGIKPFTMFGLAGKTIPMWIDDPTGAERVKNPKAKVRTTSSGKIQVLIFRKAAQQGQRKTKTHRTKLGNIVTTDVPASYPGAPGRINLRQADMRGGKVVSSGQIARGNGGVRWRHPGLAPRFFLNNALTLVSQWNGYLPIRIYVADSRWTGEVR